MEPWQRHFCDQPGIVDWFIGELLDGLLWRQTPGAARWEISFAQSPRSGTNRTVLSAPERDSDTLPQPFYPCDPPFHLHSSRHRPNALHALFAHHLCGRDALEFFPAILRDETSRTLANRPKILASGRLCGPGHDLDRNRLVHLASTASRESMIRQNARVGT